MNHYRAYYYTISIPWLATSLLILSIYLYTDPQAGDLTRIGGFTENSFGFNRKVEVFEESLFNVASGIHDYDKYYDVVVLGDSFSVQKQRSWVNYFVNETGFSVIVFHFDSVSITNIVNSEIFRKLPPKFLIYETIERALLQRNRTCSKQNYAVLPASLPEIILNPLGIDPVLLSRYQLSSRRKSNGISITARLAKKSASRFFGRNDTLAAVTSLTTKKLFTNRQSGEILYYIGDTFKKIWTDSHIDTIRCSLINMSGLTEANRKTKFIAMIFPDKLSTYGPYIANEELRNLQVIADIDSNLYTNVRLDKVFNKAVGNGIKDVYLPNDTHCSDIGYKLATNALIDKLTK